MPPGLNLLHVVIVYNKENTFGLQKDANILSKLLITAGRSIGKSIGGIKLVDMREPPIVCDICIHLEIPHPVWFQWAKYNIMFVNHEWWLESWNGYLEQFDVAMFRDEFSMKKSASQNSVVVPWCCEVVPKNTKKKGLVWFLGGSVNKRAAAESILPLWKESYPNLTVFTTTELSVQVSSNVHIRVGFLSEKDKEAVSHEALGHICFSRAESFGYPAIEAESYGGYMILNNLPCFQEYFGANKNVSWIKTPIDDKGYAVFDTDTDTCSVQLDNALHGFINSSIPSYEKTLAVSKQRKEACVQGLGKMLQMCLDSGREGLPKQLPPLLTLEDCPFISVVTLVYNRPKFIENACLNLLSTDYPKEKIEWVVIDDSDPDTSPSNRVIQFQNKFPGVVTYIPLVRKTPIGVKRNIAIEKAKHSVILMMDDDDHYPSTSFRRRVAYLQKGRREYGCAVCTTIAMYDLRTGISAVNVPPYTLSLGERCSEATLTFTRDFWNARKFEAVDMAEGENFIKGREILVAEMPPQQIIVALSHGSNTSRRKSPEGKAGCFWGFPRELLVFLHGLVGVSIEEDTSA